MSPPLLRRTSYHLDVLQPDSDACGTEPAREQTYFQGVPFGLSVGKMFLLQVGQQIPVLGQGRTVLPEPSSFRLGHGVMTERVLACQP